MQIPQGNEGEGTGGAKGGRAITRSMTAHPEGASFAPERLGPEGVSGEGAAPGVTGPAAGDPVDHSQVGFPTTSFDHSQARFCSWFGYVEGYII